MTVARAALAGSAFAAAVALAGCNADRESTMASTARSAQPLKPELVSLMTEKGMSPQDPMLVRVFKEDAKAEVWKKRKADGRYALLKSYDICRFSGKLGPKIKEGDKQAPEGFYSVTPAQMNPKSSYYLSFNLGFPNAYDRALGRTGRHVMMHGDCLSAGCYAMTDDQMAEIYAMARESFRGGQKAFQVQALPFRMTPQNIARRRDDKNMKFWKNLKQGSDAFEVTKLEPKVDACGKKYVFNAQTGPLTTIDPNAACPSYSVDPQIAKAVAAKEKTDNILIAQLSKTEPVAPEYVAQNGRLRRKLTDPVVMVAAVAPEAAGAPISGPSTATGSVAVASGAPAQAGAPAKAVNAAKPSEAAKAGQPAQATQVALSTPIASDGSAPAPSTKAETGLFARLFRSEEPAAETPIPAPAQQPATQVAAAKPAPAKPGVAREVSTSEAPVMATAVSPAPAEGGAVAKLKGWMGGLFGGQKSEEPAAGPAQQPVPASYAPAQSAPKRDRSAALPEQFAPKPKTDRNVTSSYAPAE
jgi:murein L,D-transpeptidase YafK